MMSARGPVPSPGPSRAQLTDMDTGTRVWDCELSSIDTALLLAGILDARQYFGGDDAVEIHIRHPKLGWFELGGSGIFRPEVTKPLGIEVPVAAWGLGIDRMALVALGLNDLRDLFTPDIEQVRLRRRR